MYKPDFKTLKPNFQSEDFKWYLDVELQKKIETNEADNLPSLKDLYCFIVINETKNISDYVLIDNNQNVISSYDYSFNGYEQMIAKINIIKITQHFDEHEQDTNI